MEGKFYNVSIHRDVFKNWLKCCCRLDDVSHVFCPVKTVGDATTLILLYRGVDLLQAGSGRLH